MHEGKPNLWVHNLGRLPWATEISDWAAPSYWYVQTSLSQFSQVRGLRRWAFGCGLCVGIQYSAADILHNAGSYSLLHTWTWVLCRMMSRDLFAFFYTQTSSLTSTVCWRCCLFSSVYFWLLYKNQISIGLLIHVWLPSFIPLTEVSVFMSIPCGFYCHTSVAHMPSGTGRPPAVLLFFRIALAILGFLFFSVWSWEFSFQGCKELFWAFDGDCIESVGCFW